MQTLLLEQVHFLNLFVYLHIVFSAEGFSFIIFLPMAIAGLICPAVPPPVSMIRIV